jgi:O-antigen/teichoic acid export membrane protein
MKEIKKSFWDFLAITGTSVLSVPLLLISESIQARYLGPSGYGKVALTLSAITLLHLFGSNWLSFAIMRFGKKEFINHGHLRRTISNILILVIASFFITISIFYNFREQIFKFFEIQNENFLWIILTGYGLAIIKGILFEILKVIRLIKLQSVLYRLAGKIFILIGIIALILIYLNIDVFSILVIYLLADLCLIIITFYYINLKYIFPLAIDSGFIWKIFAYSFPLIFLNWSTYVTSWIDTYVIKYYMTMQDVGIYQAAYKILNLLRSFWGMGIVTVTTPIIMVFSTKKEFGKIKQIYLQRLVPQLLFITMILLSVIILSSDYVILWIYGAKFSRAILPFKILMASHNFTTISYALMAIATSFDMTKVLFYMGLIAGVLNVSLDILLVPMLGITGASVASLITFSTVPVIWFFYIYKRFEAKRYIALIFPLFILLITGLNVININFYIKLILTIFLLVVSFLISQKFKLFLRSDILILNNIDIPSRLKQSIEKFLNLVTS